MVEISKDEFIDNVSEIIQTGRFLKETNNDIADAIWFYLLKKRIKLKVLGCDKK